MFTKEEEVNVRFQVPELKKEFKHRLKKTDLIGDVVIRVVKKSLGKQTDGVGMETYRLFRCKEGSALEWLDDYQTVGYYDICDHDVLVVAVFTETPLKSDEEDKPIESEIEETEHQILGISLVDLAALSSDSTGVPTVLSTALDYLDAHGDIQPLSSPYVDDTTKQLIHRLDQGEQVDYESENIPLIVVGSMILHILWMLPEPLLTRKLVSAFAAALSLPAIDRRQECLRATVWALPEINRLLLTRIFSRATSEQATLIDAANILGPVIGWTDDERINGQAGCNMGVNVIGGLLEAGSLIFESTEVLRPSPIVSIARATHSWEPQLEDELKFERDTVIFMSQDSGDWFFGETAIGSGLVPANYIEILAYVPRRLETPEEADLIELTEISDGQDISADIPLIDLGDDTITPESQGHNNQLKATDMTNDIVTSQVDETPSSISSPTLSPTANDQVSSEPDVWTLSDDAQTILIDSANVATELRGSDNGIGRKRSTMAYDSDDEENGLPLDCSEPE
eukprot:Ihof_evm1s414 gene=Ihof_evmTU1s414